MTFVERLAGVVDQLRPDRRVIVAVDGPDAAGKTTLADRLAGQLTRPALRASIDDWHNRREVRLRRGEESPVGYFRDSFNDEAVTGHLLRPFRAGAGRVQTAGYDFRSDQERATFTDASSPCAVLLFDGVFLLRPELRQHWDLSIYLHVPEAVTVERAMVRDAELLGGADAVRRRYERRYLPGQALYRETAAPIDTADIVLDNSNPMQPQVLRWPDLGVLLSQ